MNINNPRLKILLVILLVILIVVFVAALLAINKKMKQENQLGAPVAETQKEIKPLTPEQIQEALNQKAPENADQNTKPLTPQEIQEALNAKAK